MVGTGEKWFLVIPERVSLFGGEPTNIQSSNHKLLLLRSVG